MDPSRIVVVGAGQSGGNVAVGLREEGYTGEIALIGSEPDAPFGRPPLSKAYLRGEEDISGWIVQPEGWYADHNVSLRTGTTVERVDPSGGRVVLSDGHEVRCDAVCIATGCSPRRIEAPGSDLEGVLVLRTRDDADAVQAAARESGAKAVVVGMGFIGAEVAASLRQMGVDVTAVFPGEAPLHSVLGPRVGSVLAAMHREHGVELVPDEKVVAFRGDGRLEAVVTDAGRSFDCTFAVIGVGVTPNVAFLEGSGVDLDNGVSVDASCRTSVESVFAAGDVANHDHPLFGRIRVEHFNNAEKQGRHVARSIVGKAAPYDYVHSFWSDQYDDKIEYVGYAKGSDEFVARGDVAGRKFIGFYLEDARIRAAIGVNRGGDPEAESGSELSACAQLIRDQVTVDRSALADESRDLTAVRS